MRHRRFVLSLIIAAFAVANLLDAAKDLKIKRVVYSSSASIYGQLQKPAGSLVKEEVNVKQIRERSDLKELIEKNKLGRKLVGMASSEEAVALDVLEVGDVQVGALGGFAQEQSPIAAPPGQVSSLPVRRRPLRHLHQEREPRVRKIPEQAEVQGRPQIIRIRNEKVPGAVSQEFGQQAAGEQ